MSRALGFGSIHAGSRPHTAHGRRCHLRGACRTTPRTAAPGAGACASVIWTASGARRVPWGASQGIGSSKRTLQFQSAFPYADGVGSESRTFPRASVPEPPQPVNVYA